MRLKALIQSLLRRKHLDTDMDEEMRFHIDQYQSDLVSDGVPEGEASRRARLEFGNVSLTKENGREAKGLAMFDEFVRNVTYAFRQLRKSPGFAATVILTLGLCIGVNTAVFSVIDAALLRPLPYPEPEQLGEIVRELRRGSQFQASVGQDGHAWQALKGTNSVQVAAREASAG
ncbi:MAG: permease prefix domain 1-containing protein [Bryobacteraceae bacterium]